ncbi:MAG: hypothetical protein HYR60_17895 [Acidobacteria bacterium]|nr:hypothetical protein [Acidobacteriota bacterium]
MALISRAGFLKVLGAGALAAATEPSGKGRWFPSEMRKHKDEETGREVWQLTSSPYDSVNLYFTAQSFTRGNQGLVFMSTRARKTELYYMELKSGRFQQLTDAERGAYHACVCPGPGTVAYIDNGAIWWLKLQTLETRKIFTIPEGYTPDLLSIDGSGKYVAFAYTRRLEKALGPDQTHHSVIVRVSTDGSGHQKVHEEDYWISHVLINPTDPDTILFCHEGGWQVVAQRLWIVQADGAGLRKIRVEETPEVAIGHEHWTSHGAEVGYHGSYKGRHFLGRVNKDGSNQREYTMTAPSGHSSATEDGRLVLGDGSIEFPYISLYHFKHQAAVAEPLCTRGKIKPGDIHAHANFSSDGDFVVFASASEGHSNVYVVRTRDRRE